MTVPKDHQARMVAARELNQMFKKKPTLHPQTTHNTPQQVSGSPIPESERQQGSDMVTSPLSTSHLSDPPCPFKSTIPPLVPKVVPPSEEPFPNMLPTARFTFASSMRLKQSSSVATSVQNSAPRGLANSMWNAQPHQSATDNTGDAIVSARGQAQDQQTQLPVVPYSGITGNFRARSMAPMEKPFISENLIDLMSLEAVDPCNEPEAKPVESISVRSPDYYRDEILSSRMKIMSLRSKASTVSLPIRYVGKGSPFLKAVEDEQKKSWQQTPIAPTSARFKTADQQLTPETDDSSRLQNVKDSLGLAKSAESLNLQPEEYGNQSMRNLVRTPPTGRSSNLKSRATLPTPPSATARTVTPSPGNSLRTMSVSSPVGVALSPGSIAISSPVGYGYQDGIPVMYCMSYCAVPLPVGQYGPMYRGSRTIDSVSTTVQPPNSGSSQLHLSRPDTVIPHSNGLQQVSSDKKWRDSQQPGVLTMTNSPVHMDVPPLALKVGSTTTSQNGDSCNPSLPRLNATAEPYVPPSASPARVAMGHKHHQNICSLATTQANEHNVEELLIDISSPKLQIQKPMEKTKKGLAASMWAD